MRKFVTVTLFGILAAAAPSILGCGAGARQTRSEPAVEPRPAPAADATDPEDGALEVQLAEGNRYWEEGDLLQATRIADEILARHPQHPGAEDLLARVRSVPFCTVYPGDTLGEIAAYYYRDARKWTVLARANGIDDPRRITAFQRIRVPVIAPEPGAATAKRCEADRIRSRFFAGNEPAGTLSHEVRAGDRLEALAEKNYGTRSLASFLADFNQLENLGPLQPGSILQIPTFTGKARAGRAAQTPNALEEGMLACQSQDYAGGCERLASIPKSSTDYPNAQRQLDRCRVAGASHYEALGDEALRSSKPEQARDFYQAALDLEPERTAIRSKLGEITDMLKAVDLLGAVPPSGP
ncbi:MAG: LysM domain-containing protein [bacterium]